MPGFKQHRKGVAALDRGARNLARDALHARAAPEAMGRRHVDEQGSAWRRDVPDKNRS